MVSHSMLMKQNVNVMPWMASEPEILTSELVVCCFY